MGLLTIDEGRCKRDGFCVQECPALIIQLPEKGYPGIIPGCDDRCMDCGHCVAVCPYGALQHERIPFAKSPSILEALSINEAQAVQFLRSRRSIRHFKEKPVEQETIKRLIEVARYAPTGGNRQAVEWLVINDKSRIKEAATLTVDWLRQIVQDPQVVAAAPYLPLAIAAWDAGEDSVLRNAPSLVIALAPQEVMSGMVDLTLALSYLDVFAPAIGLGTCWAGLLQGALINSPATKAAVGIPDSYPHHYPIMVGYPDVTFYQVPERRAPKITFV
jgi:nitroreductase/NAD-dependent dihydropyrimidine dehydrogenase PreA subunit